MASHLPVSEVQGNSLPDPFTIPSILYSPEEAGGFSCDQIYEIAQKGLNELQKRDPRFKNYIIGEKRRQNNDVKFSYKIWDLFGHKEEIDRESLGKDDNDEIKVSISSYLRLLVDYMHSPAALGTVEYLLRMYKIHLYNWEDLILCSLPYHHEPEFVRIFQLVCPDSNSKWCFLLDRVKESGAAPHRRIIIQNCKADVQFLNSLCEYVSVTRTKKHKPSITTFVFTAAVILEVMKHVTTIDQVKPVLGFLDQSFLSGGSYEACGLMIIGHIPKLPLLRSQHKRFLTWIVKTREDIEWVRLSIMTLINFIQVQSVTYIPKNILVDLIKIKCFPKVLLGISEEFNIGAFLHCLMDSFLDMDNPYELGFSQVLASIIGTVPMDCMVHLSIKILSKCTTKPGPWARNILHIIHRQYPEELSEAVEQFLDAEIQSISALQSKVDMMSKMMDFLGKDKVALGLAGYKIKLVECLQQISLMLKTTEQDTFSSQYKTAEFYKTELTVHYIDFVLFGKICEDILHESFGNALCEARGFIFAPYVLDHIKSELTESSNSSMRAKKAKIDDDIPLKSWRLWALVLSSLKNCLKFLDRNNLEALLEPILSQVVVKPPSLKGQPLEPTVEKVDEWVVSCITQIATSFPCLQLENKVFKSFLEQVPKETRSKGLQEKILLALKG